MADNTETVEYPLSKFHFEVEWDNKKIGFTEVSGLDKEIELIEFRHGNSPQFNKTKMPGMAKFANIVLKKGYFKSNSDLHAWFDTISMNQVERHNITISLLDENHDATVVWNVFDAFPVKFASTDLKADANEMAIETLELAHGGFTVTHNNAA